MKCPNCGTLIEDQSVESWRQETRHITITDLPKQMQGAIKEALPREYQISLDDERFRSKDTWNKIYEQAMGILRRKEE